MKMWKRMLALALVLLFAVNSLGVIALADSGEDAADQGATAEASAVQPQGTEADDVIENGDDDTIIGIDETVTGDGPGADNADPEGSEYAVKAQKVQ